MRYTKLYVVTMQWLATKWRLAALSLSHSPLLFPTLINHSTQPITTQRLTFKLEQTILNLNN